MSSASECRIYPLSLSFSKKKEHPSSPYWLSSYREQQWTRGARCVLAAGIPPCYTTVPSIVRAVCALPRLQPAHASFNDHSWNGYPLWFRSRARYLLVERHGSSFFISITVSHVSPPCRLFDTWNMSEEVLYEVCISLLCNCVNFQYSRDTGLVELVDGGRSLYLIIGSIQEFNCNTIFFIVRKKLIVHQFFNIISFFYIVLEKLTNTREKTFQSNNGERSLIDCLNISSYRGLSFSYFLFIIVIDLLYYTFTKGKVQYYFPSDY